MLITSGTDWTYDALNDAFTEIDKIGLGEMKYDVYQCQVEVITAEQMLDAYCSIGMPILYNHWSFGKHFLRQKKEYQAGYSGLAYEIVINSNPCICYIMEQNDLMMQALVYAHAGIGHNHFFKNNHLFKQWTNAGNIIDYLDFARKFIAKCEEKHGVDEVEKVLDACHALQHNSVFRYSRKEPLSLKKEMDRKIERALYEEQTYNDLWRTLPKTEKDQTKKDKELQARKAKLRLPEENLLYFIEQYSPKLRKWQKEICRISRNIAQYFYPQAQTKVMNEGCATWTHYNILYKMYEKNLIDDGAMLEFIRSHSGVTFQPDFDKPYYSGINPYALGFAMMNDIVRICDEPTEEDRIWKPSIAGCKDSLNVLKDAWVNYRDESFVQQFLSPKVIRDFKLFSVTNDVRHDYYEVKNIHNERGYENVRNDLAAEYNEGAPEVNVVDVNLSDDRTLHLEYVEHGNKKLNITDAKLTLQHISYLWGYDVELRTKESFGGAGEIYKSSGVSKNETANEGSSEYFF